MPELCGMNSHYRFYQLETCFRIYQQLGVKHMEIWTGPMHYYVDCHGYDPVEGLMDLAARYGLNIVCICPEQTNPKPNHMAVRGADRQQGVLAYYRNIIDIAEKTGSRMVLVTSGWSYLDEPVQDGFDRAAAMMQKVCDYGALKGVTLAMESLQWGESRIVCSLKQLQRFIRAVDRPNLKVCLDLGAMAGAGDTISDYFEAFGNDVVHVHFVDGDPVGHLAWGDGTRDMKEDLRELARCGYEGYLSLETASGRYFEHPCLADQKSVDAWILAGEGGNT